MLGNRRLFCGLALATALLSGGRAESQGITGNDLFQACLHEHPAQNGYCYGYITGALEGMKWGATAILLQSLGDGERNAADLNFATDRLLGFCIPATADNTQVIQVVIRHLHGNPQGRHQAARGLIMASFISAFPCQG